MARIKIGDLGKNPQLSEDDLRKISGGAVFVKYDGVDGEATDKDHKEWINILSFSTLSSTRLIR